MPGGPWVPPLLPDKKLPARPGTPWDAQNDKNLKTGWGIIAVIVSLSRHSLPSSNAFCKLLFKLPYRLHNQR